MGLDPSKLKAGVAARIPTRTNTDDRYFTDNLSSNAIDMVIQLMFENMLNHPNITVKLSTDYKDLLVQGVEYDHLIYTGCIDEFYDYKFGSYLYCSLRFEHQHLENTEQYQSVGTITIQMT